MPPISPMVSFDPDDILVIPDSGTRTPAGRSCRNTGSVCCFLNQMTRIRICSLEVVHGVFRKTILPKLLAKRFLIRETTTTPFQTKQTRPRRPSKLSRRGPALACCWFCGHRDKMFMKLENLDDEKSIQPRVQAGSGGVDNEAWRQHGAGFKGSWNTRTVLRRWVRASETDGSAAFPGHGKLTPEQEEPRNLRREVSKLKAERDILQKAAAYFAKDQL